MSNNELLDINIPLPEGARYNHMSLHDHVLTLQFWVTEQAKAELMAALGVSDEA